MRLLLGLSVLLIALASVGEACAAEYWPMIDGSVYRYANDSGAELTISISGDELLFEFSDWYGYGYSGTEHFSTGPSGEVVLLDYVAMAENAIDPDFAQFDPGVTFLDLPLEVGKRWIVSTTADGYGPTPSTFDYRVLREEVVTVPMGTFDVFVVNEWSTVSWGYHGGDYYLNSEVGPVILPGGYELVSVEGVAVPADSKSWGSVKAMYR